MVGGCDQPEPPVTRFELPISVAPEDIDELGHVNNVVYVRWIQDVAIAHWRAAATSMQQEEYFWVAVRHEIDYKHPTLLSDQVFARTWVGAAEAARFERHTEIVRARDQKILARSRTFWCPINRRTGRLTRVSDELRRVFSAMPDQHPPT